MLSTNTFYALFVLFSVAKGFVPHSRPNLLSKRTRKKIVLYSNPFDISRPMFDLYSLRTVRGDALAKYNTLNQSEPLRINLAALLALIFLASPWLAQDLYQEPLTAPQLAGVTLGAVASIALFIRECKRRSRQLTRLEKELVALELPLRVPTNPLADSAYGPVTIVQALIRSGTRIIAISGTQYKMETTLKHLEILGRRLKQANVLVVPVVVSEYWKASSSSSSERLPWLASPGDTQVWLDYFENLANSDDFRWFGIDARGRSFGSGTSEPVWLQLLGQSLRPQDDLPTTKESIPVSEDEKQVLEQQSAFYQALTTGNLEAIHSIFCNEKVDQVTEIIEQNGRLDDWSSCLEDGARPAGMEFVDSDVTILEDNDLVAYSTTIEVPATMEGATLLAVQEWVRKDAESEWKLFKHQTIPWSTTVAAAGTLICDCRGCVSLVRSKS
jgi:hypothetical protein